MFRGKSWIVCCKMEGKSDSIEKWQSIDPVPYWLCASKWSCIRVFSPLFNTAAVCTLNMHKASDCMKQWQVKKKTHAPLYLLAQSQYGTDQILRTKCIKHKKLTEYRQNTSVLSISQAIFRLLPHSYAFIKMSWNIINLDQI